MKVLIADRFPKFALRVLEQKGISLAFEPHIQGDTLVAELTRHQPHALVVRSTPVEEAAILASKRLSLIVRAGASYNTIDVEAASRLGIHVSTCPGKNAVAVAELTMGLILAIDRRIPDNVFALREGYWRRSEYSMAAGLKGKKIGLIGIGQVAREVIQRARAFALEPICWSRSLTPERASRLGVDYCRDLIELAASADIVSLHLALTPETRELLGPKFFAAMKPSAIFINTARAEIVNRRALADAIEKKDLRVGIDVYWEQPDEGNTEFKVDFASPDRFYGTHHIGASTKQAQAAIADAVITILEQYQTSGQVTNSVNLCLRSPAKCLLIIRHLDKVGVLASVFHALKTARINVEEMSNIIFSGNQAATARISLSKIPQPSLLASLQEDNSDILSLDVIPTD